MCANDLLEDELPRAREESKDFAFSPTDVISYAMFDNVAKVFLDERNSNNLKPESIEIFENVDEKINKDFNITVNGEQYSIRIEGSGITNNGVKPFFVRLDGELKEIFVEQNCDDKASSIVESKKIIKEGNITSSMPGRVIKINYSLGDKVKKGDVLAIIEAMKMENEVVSNISGEIKAIYIDINSQVSNNEPIMLIE